MKLMWSLHPRLRSIASHLALSATVLATACSFAGGHLTLEARLAIDEELPLRDLPPTPRFTECTDCPVVEYQSGSASPRSVTVAHDALYTMQAEDVDEFHIYEQQSVYVLGETWFWVIAKPSHAWLESTKDTRESYPRDSVMWFAGDEPLMLTFNISSHVQGRFHLGLFPCQSQATELVERIGGEAEFVRQSDEEYAAAVAEMNAHYKDLIERLRSDPDAASDYPGDSAELERLLARGAPELPMSAEEYYGRPVDPPDCD